VHGAERRARQQTPSSLSSEVSSVISCAGLLLRLGRSLGRLLGDLTRGHGRLRRLRIRLAERGRLASGCPGRGASLPREGLHSVEKRIPDELPLLVEFPTVINFDGRPIDFAGDANQAAADDRAFGDFEGLRLIGAETGELAIRRRIRLVSRCSGGTRRCRRCGRRLVLGILWIGARALAETGPKLAGRVCSTGRPGGSAGRGAVGSSAGSRRAARRGLDDSRHLGEGDVANAAN
jgi:hypothetical protein